MFRTKYNGEVFNYDDWNNGGTIGMHRDSIYMIELVFYNSLIHIFNAKQWLTCPQYKYHIKCMDSHMLTRRIIDDRQC